MSSIFDNDSESVVCQVVINERQVFCPGEKITGAVKLYITKIRYAKRIAVKICGQAYVRWSEFKQFETNEYVNCETYVNESRTLLECADDDERERLLPGDNHYHFSFVIPPSHLPSSFNHGWHKKNYAVIRYWVGASVSYDDGQDVTAAREFYMKETMDLSKALHWQHPRKMSADELVSWCCFKTGPVVLHMKIMRSGYYSGDDIVITAGVDTTLSSTRTGKVDVELVQRVTYVANLDYSDRSFSKSDGKLLEKEHWDVEKSLLLSASVGCGRQMNWDNVKLKIPKTIIPTISCSKCIQLTYFVQLKVDLCLSEDCIIRIPIVIVAKPRLNLFKDLQDITDDNSSQTQDTDLE